MPADNAMLMNPPEELTLVFTKEVRVVKVSLANKQGEEFKFDSSLLKSLLANLHGNYLN